MGAIGSVRRPRINGKSAKSHRERPREGPQERGPFGHGARSWRREGFGTSSGGRFRAGASRRRGAFAGAPARGPVSQGPRPTVPCVAVGTCEGRDARLLKERHGRAHARRRRTKSGSSPPCAGAAMPLRSDVAARSLRARAPQGQPPRAGGCPKTASRHTSPIFRRIFSGLSLNCNLDHPFTSKTALVLFFMVRKSRGLTGGPPTCANAGCRIARTGKRASDFKHEGRFRSERGVKNLAVAAATESWHIAVFRPPGGGPPAANVRRVAVACWLSPQYKWVCWFSQQCGRVC